MFSRENVLLNQLGDLLHWTIARYLRFYSDFCYGSQRLKLHRILKKLRFIKDLRIDGQNIWFRIMTEATIQFDFNLSSSYFLLPKHLILPMKLSNYITMLSSAFCTTKKKKLFKKFKKHQKISYLTY